MKFLQTFILVIIAQLTFAQISSVEQKLNTEEQKLYSLEQKLQTLKQTLLANGQDVNSSYQIVTLKDQIKTQKQVVKTARKNYKGYKKSLNVATTSVSGNSAVIQSQPDNKAEIKAITKELKTLRKQKKNAESIALSMGIEPEKDGTSKAIQSKISQLESKLNQLQPKVAVVNTSNNTVNVPTGVNSVAPQSSGIDLKSLKSEIKQLKKQKKQLLKEAKQMQINPANDSRIVSIDDKLYSKQVEYARLNQLPIPEKKQLPNYSLNANDITTTVENPTLNTSVVDNSLQIKAARKELKSLIKQQRKAAKQAIKNQQNPAQDKTVVMLGKQIKNKQAYLYQLEQGVVNPSVEVVSNTAQVEQVEVKENYPSIGLSTILFEKYNTEINEEYKNYISKVAKQLKDNPDLALRIDGYTDNTEKAVVSYEYTQKLVLNVAQEFINRGVDKSRILIQANGSKKSLGDNKTLYGQARNRRVELSFTQKPKVEAQPIPTAN